MKRKDIYCILLIILSFIMAILTFNKIPEMIPIHWGINGEADNFVSKYFTFLLPIIILILYLLFKFIPKIDPRKNNYEKYKKSYENIICAFISFLFALYICTLLIYLGYNIPITKITLIAVGVLFMIIGNYLPKSKSNFYFGIKTPWTLSNDTVWKKTHRLGGKLFTIGGLAIILTSIFLKNGLLFFSFIVITLIISIIPTIMSYVYFKKEC